MRIVSVVGARPQFVKLSAVCAALSAEDEHLILHTGQHYDYAMSQSFFDALGMPAPDRNLEVGSAHHGAQTGAMLEGIETYLIETKPDWVLVFGDTNSTLAGAIAAAKLHIPIAHLEAGLRSWNRLMPEEINRVLTDHASTLCFAPTQGAFDNLEAEGLGERSALVGDVTAEIICSMLTRLKNQPPTLPWDVSENYWFATLHRQELTTNDEKLREILGVLFEAPVNVYLAAHPGLRHVMSQMNTAPNGFGSLHLVDPLDFPSVVWALKHAQGVITDSGGLQKEAYLLQVPCATFRKETEWVETLTNGWNRLAWDNPRSLLDSSWTTRPKHHDPGVYGDGDAAKRAMSSVRAFREVDQGL